MFLSALWVLGAADMALNRDITKRKASPKSARLTVSS